MVLFYFIADKRWERTDERRPGRRESLGLWSTDEVPSEDDTADDFLLIRAAGTLRSPEVTLPPEQPSYGPIVFNIRSSQLQSDDGRSLTGTGFV